MQRYSYQRLDGQTASYMVAFPWKGYEAPVLPPPELVSGRAPTDQGGFCAVGGNAGPVPLQQPERGER